MEPLSASIRHLIHHLCQVEGFWCQRQAARTNRAAGLCASVHVMPPPSKPESSFPFVFFQPCSFTTKAYGCLLANMWCVSLPVGLSQANETSQRRWSGKTCRQTGRPRPSEGKGEEEKAERTPHGDEAVKQTLLATQAPLSV